MIGSTCRRPVESMEKEGGRTRRRRKRVRRLKGSGGEYAAGRAEELVEED